MNDDKLLHDMLMENKRCIERDAIDILAGAQKITVRGPKEYRPEVPEELKGILLRGMTGRNMHETEEQKKARRKRAEEYNAELRKLYGIAD